MIKASEARELANKAELEQLEKDLNFIYKNIKSYALNGYSYYNHYIDHLSRQGQKLLKHTLKADGYKVRFGVTPISGSEYYMIEW